MYALYTTVEHVPGTRETKLHGTYARQEDAEQIGGDVEGVDELDAVPIDVAREFGRGEQD